MKLTAPQIDSGEAKIGIPLPSGTKLDCQEGDEIAEDEVLGQVVSKGEIKEYDLAKILKVNPKKVQKFLLCSLGSEIKTDQLIAEKKSVFGSVSFKSPVSGLVEALTEKGILKIRITGGKINIEMPVKGEIEKISSNSMTIKFPAIILKATKGLGGEAWGTLKLLGEDGKKTDFNQLGDDVKGKILVIPGKINQALFHKSEALGAVGLVGGEFDQEESEELILLEAGEKEGLISEKIWQELSKYQEKKAFISGEKKELIIPK